MAQLPTTEVYVCVHLHTPHNLNDHCPDPFHASNLHALTALKILKLTIIPCADNTRSVVASLSRADPDRRGGKVRGSGTNCLELEETDLI